MLDRLESGIIIDSLSLTEKFPPRRVMPKYYQVQAAESQSAAMVETAVSSRREVLQATAGDAAEAILAQIDQYELDLAKKDTAAAEATFARIEALLLGRSVELEGRSVNPRVSGAVATLLDGARQERTTIVSQARSEAELFAAKLEAFKVNPKVLLNGDWADAYQTFVSRSGTQVMLLPADAIRTVLMINRDPVLVREQEIARNTQQFEEADRERMRETERNRFERRMNSGTAGQ
jgi:hypothetical protein